MTRRIPGRLVLFEPWSLGDVIIAASALRELDCPAALACHPMWHPIVRGIFSGKPDFELVPIALPYTTRNRAHSLDSSGGNGGVLGGEEDLVLSIRGDARDYAAARKLFPRARIKMTGWIRFLGRKSACVNALFAAQLLSVQNRYRSWASLVGISFSQLEETYRQLQSRPPQSGKVAIHLGAQWRSKQFPGVALLRDQLCQHGWEVVLVAGPNDPLPVGIDEGSVVRAADLELIALFRSAEHVIANDSGPMHLAAFLGCPTTVIVRTSPIEEWLPPATSIVASAITPHGYRPHRDYMSDKVLSDWPHASTVFEAVGAGQPGFPV